MSEEIKDNTEKFVSKVEEEKSPSIENKLLCKIYKDTSSIQLAPAEGHAMEECMAAVKMLYDLTEAKRLAHMVAFEINEMMVNVALAQQSSINKPSGHPWPMHKIGRRGH